jgi:putative lipoic acid-binding regulatory protein
MSANNGLSIDLVGELLVSLGRAVGLKKEDELTLSGIKGNCYALDFTTNSEPLYSSMEIVHKKISENEFSGFNSDQRKYAAKLNSIIRDKGCRVNFYNSSKTFNYKIVNISLESKVESYFEIDSVYGIIASIGSSSLDSQPSIKLSKEGYDIHITGDQEQKLVKHFKKSRLLLTVKKKINFETNKIESASLIDFEVMGSKKETFSDEANKLVEKHKKRGLFPKVKDTVSSVRNLRGNLNQVS